MKKPKQRFLEKKLDEMIERICQDGSEMMKKHYNKKIYKNKDVDEFHERFLNMTGQKYQYGYDITFFVSNKPFAADKLSEKK